MATSRPGGIATATVLRSIGIAAALFLGLAAVPVRAEPSVPADPACTGVATPGLRDGLLLTGAKLRQKQAISILAIGSSSTEGAGASSPVMAYPQTLARSLVDRLGRSTIEVVNAGIGGETASQTIERLTRLTRERHFDLVIWQVGTNDAVRGESEERFRDLLTAGIEAVLERGSDLLLMDQQFFPTVRDPARYERYVDILGEVAADRGVPVFHRYKAMQAWALKTPADFPAMLSGDRFHMSDRGYACIAHLLSDELAGLEGTPLVARGPKRERPADRPVIGRP